MISVSIIFLFGGRKNMYKSMKTLITKHFYKTGEAAQKKLDVFYAVNRLSDDEYTELTALVATVYGADEAAEDTPEAEA